MPEQVQIENYLVTIAKTDGRRVEQLHFRKLDEGTEPPKLDQSDAVLRD